MAAQTSTNRISNALIQRLYGLHAELSGGNVVALATNATTTITIVHTTATGASTLNSSTT